MYKYLSFSGYILNDYEKPLENKASSPHQDLIGNYHYVLNIEHAKPVFEECLIVNSLFGDIPTLNNQLEGKGILQASLYIYPSQI